MPGLEFQVIVRIKAGEFGDESDATFWSFGAGGGGSSAHYALNQVTIDQAGANTLSSSASARLCTGWECAGWSYNPSLYLPFVER